jgi:chemotaxis signal transduction protein
VGDKILTFELSDRRYAVPLELVREVAAAGSITPVPGAPRGVAGLVQVRGLIATALDLGQLAGGKARPPRAGDTLLILEIPPQPWSDGQPAHAGVVADRVLGLGAAQGGAGRAELLDVVAMLDRLHAEAAARVTDEAP